MVSFRFPFSFSQPPRATSFSGFSISAVAASVTVAAGAAIAVSRNPKHPILEWAFCSQRSSLLPWGSITLADSTSESVVEPKTGFSFPASIGDSRRLLGVGLRKKSLLGLKNIDVYAFGKFIRFNFISVTNIDDDFIVPDTIHISKTKLMFVEIVFPSLGILVV